MIFLAASEILNWVAALTFLIAGVVLLVSALRNSIRKSRLAVENELRKQQAQSEYWRTIDKAVEALSELIEDISSRSDKYAHQVQSLIEEATDKQTELSKLIQEMEEETREHKEASAPSNKSEEPGRIVNFRTASEALVKRTHRKVYDAFDRGQTIQEISHDTGLQIGEIELILALRERMIKDQRDIS